MPAQILSSEPVELVVGTRVQWTIRLDDWAPADGALTVQFQPADGSAGRFSITPSTDPSDSSQFLATLDDATTSGKTPGAWLWGRKFVAGGESYFVGAGSIQFLPNIFDAAVDTRSSFVKMRDGIVAVLAGDENADVSSYSWKDRSLQKASKAELLDALAWVTEEIRFEENARAIANGEPLPHRSTIRLELP